MTRFLKFLKDEAFILFWLAFLIYFNTSIFPGHSDTVPNLFLPVNLISGKGFYFDHLYPFLMKEAPIGVKEGVPYYLAYLKGHYVSDYPILTGLMATPIYLIPVLVKNIRVENIFQTYGEMPLLGKLSASIFTALSAAFLYLALRQLTEKKKALLLTGVYAFGGSSFSISSQTIWQHGASQLWLALAIYFLVRGQKESRFLALSGLPLGLAAVTRFPNLLPGLVILVYLLLYQRRQFIKAGLLFSLPLIFLLFYNWQIFGQPWTGGYSWGEDKHFRNSLLTGASGLLFAPSKGLLAYSPVFLFSFWGAAKAFFDKKQKLLVFFFFAFVSFFVLVAKWNHWHGGWSFGPRMLVDMTPFLTMLILPVVNSRSFKNILVSGIFYLLLGVSFLIQLFGVSMTNDLAWYQAVVPDAKSTSYLWYLKKGEIWFYIQKQGGPGKTLLVMAKEFFGTVGRSLRLGIAVGIFYLLGQKSTKHNERK